MFLILMSESFLKYIRSLNCLVAEDWGHECIGKIHAHHVRSRGAGGGDEANVVPLCFYHHRRVHDMGRLTFQKHYVTNFKLMAHEIHYDYQRSL